MRISTYILNTNALSGIEQDESSLSQTQNELSTGKSVNTPADNPITDHGATLGRVLFYDTRLSANNTVACASCHHQKNGFVDPNKASKGFEGKLTDRHAPSLAELRFTPRGRFFWDERVDAVILAGASFHPTRRLLEGLNQRARSSNTRTASRAR